MTNNNIVQKISVSAEQVKKRLDQFLAEELALSRSQVQQLIEAGHVKLPGKTLSPAQRVKIGEEFEIMMPTVAVSELMPQDIKLDILYCDDDIIVINKAANMVVHPSLGHANNTLVNALLFHFPDIVISQEQRPGIVHRLDKETSGVMICARNNHALHQLMLAFKNRQVEKIYRAFCWGNFTTKNFELKTGHRRHLHDRKRYTTKIKAPTEEGNANKVRLAHSAFEVLRAKEKISELRVHLFTGRTHQIRAHLADIHHPLLMDTLYGSKKNLNALIDEKLKIAVAGLKRHALHAEGLSLNHPRSGEKLTFAAPLPLDLELIHEAIIR